MLFARGLFSRGLFARGLFEDVVPGPRFRSLDLYDGNPLDGGALVGSFATATNLQTVFDIDWTREQLSFEYARQEIVDANGYFHEGMFLVRRVAHGGTTDSTAHWLVREINRNSVSGGCSVIADPIAVLLKDIMVREISGTGFPNTRIGTADATPTTHFAAMVSAMDTRWPAWLDTTPEIEPTDRFDFASDNLTLAEWCDTFAKAIGSEFRLVFNPATNKYVFTFPLEIGSDADAVVVETGKNLQALQLRHDYNQAATRVLPSDSEGRELWHVEAKISAKSTNVLTLVDPLGRDIDMVPFDDCLNDHWLVKDTATFADDRITDCTAPNLVTVVSGSGYTVGDTVLIKKDTGVSGTRMQELVNPAAEAAGYALRRVPLPRPDIIATRNLIKNGFMREYSNPSSVPDGYTFTQGGSGATVTRSANNSLYGGYTARIRGAAGSSNWQFKSPLGWPHDAGPDSLHCAKIRVTVAALSSASIEVTITGGYVEEITAIGTFDISLPALDLSSATSGFQVQLSGAAGGGTTNDDVYVDVIQVTPGLADPQVYVEGSNTNLLYKVAADTLIARNPSARNFTMTFADLARLISPNPWSLNMITLGGPIRLKSSELTVDESIRVVRYALNDDPDQVMQSTVLLQGQRERFVAQLQKQQASVIQDSVGPIARKIAAEIERVSTGDTTVAFTGTTAGSDTFALTNEQVGLSLMAPRLRSIGKQIT